MPNKIINSEKVNKTIKEIESKLWKAANALRGNLSAEDYMHIVLGILTLKYLSDKHDLAIERIKEKGLEVDDLDDAELFDEFETFRLNDKSNWEYVLKYVKSGKVGEYIDNALLELEKNNGLLRGIFRKDYNREGIDQIKLASVVEIFNEENLCEYGEDIIGRIYEYFLGAFFRDRGQSGGEFYTPDSIVRLMVNLIKPQKGKVYDPCCGTGGMLVQCKKYIEEHGGDLRDITAWGQEYNNTTWKLCALNLLLNGFNLKSADGQNVLGDRSADTFIDDQHKLVKFDYILANPPFNQKSWGQEQLKNDPRFTKYGLPPRGNGNYAWLEHILSKLSSNGKAAVILAKGSLSSYDKDEKGIREKFVEFNKIDAIIELPDKLFYTTEIPACIWVFDNAKTNNNILMVSASTITGNMLSKKLRELKPEEIQNIAELYSKHKSGQIINEPGIAKSINKEELIANDYSFVPGRYVETIKEEIDEERTKNEIKNLGLELETLFDEFEKILPKVKESIKKSIDLNK